MSVGEVQRLPGARRRVLEHVRVPLYRDGYALALNAALTAGVGLLYWIVAAHVYSPRIVGVNSALISAMMFVAGVATLNLSNILVRFLPAAGRRARRLIGASYAATAGVAVAGAVLFAAGAAGLSERLQFVDSSPALAVGFVAATVAWCVFVLQDGALTGLGRSVWVPAENTAFGVVKLALLFAFAGLMPQYGIFASWALAMVLTVVAVNALLFGRILPRREQPVTAEQPFHPRAFAGYFFADWLCSIAWLATTTLLPVIVTAVSGPSVNASFALAWAVAFPLYSVASSIGTALLVHGAGEPGALDDLRRRSARQGAVLLGAAVLGLVIAAPLALSLFGESYADDATTLLRLLVLGALPNFVIVLWVSAARVRRRLRGAVAALVGQAAITLALLAPMLHEFGVEGAGIAWLIGQCTTAAAVVVAARVAHAPSRRDAEIGRKLTGGARLRKLKTDSDVTVLAADGRVVKLGHSAEAASRIGQHAAAVARLRAIPGLQDWSELLPQPVAVGSGHLVERALPGVDGRLAPPQVVLEATADAMRVLYDATDVRMGRADEWLASYEDVLARMAGDRGRRLVDTMRRDLALVELRRGWTHGDLWQGNVLVADGGARVTGIVDWEAAEPDGVTAADLAHLVICTREVQSGWSLGTVVARLADGRDALTAAERAALAHAGELPPVATLARLGWLQHVCLRHGQVTPHPRGLWARRTLDPVLGR